MSVVFTIGYEGTDLDSFVETLKAAHIEVLADVRAIAASRKKGFSKTALRNRLEAEGITYLHFPKLGDPKEGREAAKSGNYEKFRAIYGAHIQKPESLSDLKNLAEVVFSKATCLLCYEREPKHCHRSIVAKKLEQYGVVVFDLFGDDPKRYVRNSSKVPRHNPSQSITAAE